MFLACLIGGYKYKNTFNLKLIKGRYLTFKLNIICKIGFLFLNAKSAMTPAKLHKAIMQNIYTILTRVPSGLRADSAYFAFEIESGGHKKNPRQLGAAGFSVHNR